MRTDFGRNGSSPINKSTALAVLLWMIAPAPGQASDVIKASPVGWSISGEFDGGKEAKNISGAACAVSTGTRKSCLLVSDEKLYARFFDITGTTISLKAKIPILPAQSGTQSFKETDGEGVDFDQGRYYVIGSHGTSKNHGDYQASRFFIYRFSVDAATGMPPFPITGDDPAKEVERSDRLEAILKSIPMLRDYACTRAQAECKSLQEHGINIEGVAVRNGSIYLGFRAPSLDGAGFVVRVAEDAVFGDAPAAPQVFRPRLGVGMGIRDLVKVQDGFLILAGAELPEKEGDVGKAELFFWRSDSADVTPLGALAGMKTDVKPEALLVLEEQDSAYRVLVLSDGPAGGNPTEYSVLRSK